MVDMLYRFTLIFTVLFLTSGAAQSASNHISQFRMPLASQLGAFKYESHLLDQAILDYNDDNYTNALTKFMLLSSNQNADAEYYLGMMHQYGLGIAVNEKRAQYWLNRAAKQRHAGALSMLRKVFPKSARLKNDTTKISRTYFHTRSNRPVR